MLGPPVMPQNHHICIFSYIVNAILCILCIVILFSCSVHSKEVLCFPPQKYICVCVYLPLRHCLSKIFMQFSLLISVFNSLTLPQGDCSVRKVKMKCAISLGSSHLIRFKTYSPSPLPPLKKEEVMDRMVKENM